MARATHTCNDVYQVENNVKFLTAEALRGVNSLIFDAQGSRLANVLGKRDYVIGTALEQGCDVVQTVLKPQRLSSRSSSTRSSTSLSRRRGRTPVSQTLSEDHRDSTVKGFRDHWRLLSCSTLSKWSMSMLRVQKTAQMRRSSSSRSWLTTLCSCEPVPAAQVQQRIVEMPQIQVPAIRQSGEHSSCATDSINARCRATRKIQKVVETTQVQFKEMNLQYRNGCRPSRRSRRLLRSCTL